jgi:hypothetical protein
MGRPVPTTPWPPVGRHDRGEQTTGETVVLAREEFEASRDGRRGVGASRSIDEAGEPPAGPRGEKGTPGHGTVGGKQGGCIGTRRHVNAQRLVADRSEKMT